MRTARKRNKAACASRLKGGEEMPISIRNTSTSKRKSQDRKDDHWFRKMAETIPVYTLPNAVVGAVRGIMFSFNSTKNKVRDIREIIEIYDELIKR